MLQRYKKKSQRHHAVTTFLRFFSRSHAACSSQSGNNRRCDRRNHLYDELNSFSLCHGNRRLMVNVSLGFAAWLRKESLMFHVKRGLSPRAFNLPRLERRPMVGSDRRYLSFRRLRCFRCLNRYRLSPSFRSSGCRC